MEAGWITNARTGALAAVAAQALAPRPPQRLGLVGAGRIARATLNAMGHVFPSLSEVRVASRTVDSRQRFCEEFAGRGRDVVAVDVQDAVAGVDIVVSSTSRPSTPPIAGSWWQPGTLAIALDGLDSWDASAFAQADHLVADDLPGVEALNLERPTALPLPQRRSALARALRPTLSGERVIVVSLGPAALDMAVAAEIHRRAVSRGIGQKVRLA
jgi:ornithine cyclodeaminase/alanine dehydrogenase-like protein (mu-crystallin family)